MPRTTSLRLTAATALAPALWGTTYLVTTRWLPHDRPLLAGTVRALPAGLLLIAAGRRLPRGEWWWKAVVLGALNIGAFFALLFVAAYRLPGGVAATLGAVQPLVVAGLSVGLLGERLRARTVAVGLVAVLKALLLDEPERWASVFDSDHAESPPDGENVEAFLQRMRRYAKQGATLDLEENEPGIRCVAAAVRNGSGAIVAAISISAINPYMPSDRMRALVPVMQQAALAISQRLGYTGPRPDAI
jgi:hypothetical protein